MVEVDEVVVPGPPAEFTAAERDRLAGLLERYRSLVARAAGGETLGPGSVAVAVQVLSSLWLAESSFPRDVAAWREMETVRAQVAGPGSAEVESRSRGADVPRHRLRLRALELEVLHPHLFGGVQAAALWRWKATRRWR
jgi:hypothetical protein